MKPRNFDPGVLIQSWAAFGSSFDSRAERCRRPGRYFAWHGNRVYVGMIELLLVISGLFGAGFAAGYGVRELVSRRRQRQYRGR
jgi:hypothetical protein